LTAELRGGAGSILKGVRIKARCPDDRVAAKRWYLECGSTTLIRDNTVAFKEIIPFAVSEGDVVEFTHLYESPDSTNSKRLSRREVGLKFREVA